MTAGPRAAYLSLCLAFSAPGLHSILSPEPPAPLSETIQTPQWWEVCINMRTDGDYKLDEGEPAHSGHYIFTIRWTGWLEKDDQDYLLYRLDCRLGNWEAQETSFSAESPGVLTTGDFQERPFFNLKYIIKEGDDLHLDFIVSGMAVPLADPENAFPLLLPSSEQNGQQESQVDYNACVVKGSNRVELPESAIYAGPVNKKYNWTWRHQQWVPKERRTVFTSQSHKVEVNVSIIPHFARPKSVGP